MKYLILFLYSTILAAQVVGTGTEDFTCGTLAQEVQLAQSNLIDRYGSVVSSKPTEINLEDFLSLLTFKITSKSLNSSSIDPSSELIIACEAVTEEGKDCKSLANETLIKLSIDLKDFSSLTKQAKLICTESNLEIGTHSHVNYLYSNDLKKHLKTIEELIKIIDKTAAD